MIRFIALGSPEFHGEVGPSAAAIASRPRVLALLTYLVLARPRGLQRRDSLVALFWPELDHDGARSALRQVLHRLRREIGEDVVVGRGADEVGIDPERLQCDVVAFEAAVDAGRYEEALDLYRAELLPGFFVDDAPDFERWLEAERVRLRQRAAAAAWAHAEAASRAGEHAVAAERARRAAAISPDDEAGVRRHLAILIAGGDRATALRLYEAFEKRLLKEFGVAPARETRALVINLPTPVIEAAAEGEPARTPPVARGRPSRAAAMAGVAAAAILATGLLLTRGDASTVPTVKTLAVLPFTVRGSSDVRYLGEGMADLLAAKLNDGSGFRASDPHAVMAALPAKSAGALDLDEGAAIARKVEAGWMITGQLVEIAGRLEVSATLYELRGRRGHRAATTASVSGETTALFQLVDDLTGRLLAGIAVGRDTSLVRLSALTTTSLPALMAFLEGEQALRAGLDARAVTAYRRAVDLDSTFAIAGYRLALSSTWASLPGSERAPEWADLAARHADGLSPFARDLVRGYAAYKALRGDEAERTYRALVTAHPDNVEGWMMLGETLFHYGPSHGRPSAEGRAPFERVLALDPDNPHALTHLARQAALDGRLAALDSLVERYARTHATAERLLEMQALAAFARDDSAARASVAAAALDVGDVAFVGLLQGGLDYAENPSAYHDLLPAAARADRRFTGLAVVLMQMADVEPARGRLASADPRAPFDSPLIRAWRLETEALLATDPVFGIPAARARELRSVLARQPSYPNLNQYSSFSSPETGRMMRHYLVGLLSLRLGDSLAARDEAAALQRAERGPLGDRARAFGIALRAEGLRLRGEHAAALATLDSFPFAIEPLRVYAHHGVRERFVRGELLAALGREEEALRAYGSLTNAYDLPFVALSHLRRAAIQVRRDDREAARFHYGRFLRWWSEADPERQPVVTAAREALAQLER